MMARHHSQTRHTHGSRAVTLAEQKQVIGRFGTGMLLLVVALMLLLALPAHGASRIKDIAQFEGVRDNLLVGYGLVVGLNGTGDSIDNINFTRESLVSMLERLGVNTRGADVDTENVAAVMVTSVLPPFSRQGTRVDVSVSALGDSESLLGGTLLVTPLVGADGEVYAVAQGPVAVGGFTAQGDAETITKGVPTSGRIAGGAIVEREIVFNLNNMQKIDISLRNPDFTTSRRVAEAINSYFGTAAARPVDPATVRMQIPPGYRGDTVSMITDIEGLRVVPDNVAKVVIDEQSGVIVMGKNVRINEVAIAQGNLTIRITETPQVAQPTPFSQGQTEVVPRTNIQVDEQADRRFAVLDPGVSLQELVNGLNALGIGPRDMITILQAIKAAGALQAEIEVI